MHKRVSVCFFIVIIFSVTFTCLLKVNSVKKKHSCTILMNWASLHNLQILKDWWIYMEYAIEWKFPSFAKVQLHVYLFFIFSYLWHRPYSNKIYKSNKINNWSFLQKKKKETFPQLYKVVTKSVLEVCRREIITLERSATPGNISGRHLWCYRLPKSLITRAG